MWINLFIGNKTWLQKFAMKYFISFYFILLLGSAWLVLLLSFLSFKFSLCSNQGTALRKCCAFHSDWITVETVKLRLCRLEVQDPVILFVMRLRNVDCMPCDYEYEYDELALLSHVLIRNNISFQRIPNGNRITATAPPPPRHNIT